MPTNLLNSNSLFNPSIFRDEHGNIPVIKERNRIGNIVYTIPEGNAQICFRILSYEICDNRSEMFNAIVSEPESYRFGYPDSNIRIERMTRTNYSTRVRTLVGIKFIADIPTRGAWGRYVSYTTRTVYAHNGKLSLNTLKNKFNELNRMFLAYREREDARARIHRIEREQHEREANQARTFLNGILERFPLENSDDIAWRNNFEKVCLSITIDKHQIAKVLDAIHNIRAVQTNPLDMDYLLSKDN